VRREWADRIEHHVNPNYVTDHVGIDLQDTVIAPETQDAVRVLQHPLESGRLVRWIDNQLSQRSLQTVQGSASSRAVDLG
jgi:hypothetical protein